VAPIPVRPLALGPDELAARLAQFLWAEPPDAALTARIAALAPRDTSAVAMVAGEMLDDPRARAGVLRFYRPWLELVRVNTTALDPAQYPQDAPELRALMVEEAELYVAEQTLSSAGTFQSLLASPTTIASPRLAQQIYGMAVSDPQGPPRRLTLDPAQRAGLLTLPGVLLAHPRASSRGTWVLSKLACVDLPEPPAGHLTAPSVPSGSFRKWLEGQVRAMPFCGTCHEQFDPLGFVFEHLDSLGRYRAEDNGVPVDAQVTMEWRGRTFSFDRPARLGEMLAADCEVQACFARRWLELATSRGADSIDRESQLGEVAGAFAASGLGLRGLLLAVVQSRLFLGE
jgi:hypothetical protein